MSAPVLERAKAWMAKRSPAIEGQRGDAHTYATACYLAQFHQLGLSEAQCWALLVEWNRTCQPPWKERDLRVKLRNAFRNMAGNPMEDRPMAGSPTPTARPTGPQAPTETAAQVLQRARAAGVTLALDDRGHITWTPADLPLDLMRAINARSTQLRPLLVAAPETPPAPAPPASAREGLGTIGKIRSFLERIGATLVERDGQVVVDPPDLQLQHWLEPHQALLLDHVRAVWAVWAAHRPTMDQVFSRVLYVEHDFAPCGYCRRNTWEFRRDVKVCRTCHPAPPPRKESV